MSDFVCRLATAEDIGGMALVMEQASAARKKAPAPTVLSNADDEAYLRERINRAGAWAWVALDGDRIIGFICGNPVENKIEDIGLVMVAPEYWGKGVGSALMNVAADFHRGNNKSAVELWTQKDNVRARRLYERKGYRLTGATKIHERLGEEMVRYRLDL